jgi:hypothetical protein
MTLSDADKYARSLTQRFGSLEVAMRQNDLAWEARDYLKTHPNAPVVKPRLRAGQHRQSVRQRQL